jgi:hypothetical protein
MELKKKYGFESLRSLQSITHDDDDDVVVVAVFRRTSTNN